MLETPTNIQMVFTLCVYLTGPGRDWKLTLGSVTGPGRDWKLMLGSVTQPWSRAGYGRGSLTKHS